MSTLTAALIVVVLIAAGLLLLALGLCRAAGMASRAEETRGRVWDFEEEEWIDPPVDSEPGPKQMTGRQIADADGLDLLYLSRAYDPATDPQWAAGRARLLDAIRDERTNTTEGEL